jgi:hypothetical protein
MSIDLGLLRRAFNAEGKLFDGAPELTFLRHDDTIQQHLTALSEQYSVKIETEPQAALLSFPLSSILELNHILTTNVPAAIRDFMMLLPEILKRYEAQLETSRAAYLARQRELEEARKPAWLKALTRLKAQGSSATCPDLANTVTLPKEWPALLSKEQLGAFLALLKLPASSREIKSNLIQHLSPHLETDKTALAQFFEVFAIELAVPPWELETLLRCTTTERKRWVEEERFPVLAYSSFHKAGNDYDYAVYDRRVIMSLTRDDIERWRAEHQELVRERRRTAAQAAAAVRKAKQKEAQLEELLHGRQ